MNNENMPGFSKVHYDIYRKIDLQLFTEIPSFNKIWNPAIESSMKISPFDPVQGRFLGGYIESLFLTCKEGLYAIQCLNEFSTHELSNITEFYVRYFLNDFFIRVKTGTDLLSLIIKHVYKLNIDDKKCSLENGTFINRLRSTYLGSQKIESLAKEIDRGCNLWLKNFDTLRDIAIHQGSFKFVIGNLDSDYPVHLILPIPKELCDTSFPKDTKNPLMPSELFNKIPLCLFLSKIKSKSFSNYFSSINPLSLCKEIWNMWINLTENILNICVDDILSKLEI
jgi:hypothetical protein